jgi:hypothetical protein
MDIIVDPADASQKTWFTTVYSGWGGPPNGLGGLYKTTDRGNSWVKLTGSQFDRVTSITYNPLAPNQAYLTTETQGLWISNTMNLTTPTWKLVDSYPFRQPEKVFFNPFNQHEMWVTSFGNGMKVGFLYPAGIDAINQGNSLIRVYPNPVKNIVSIETDEISDRGTLFITTISGKEILVQKIKGYKTELDIRNLPDGVYLLRFINDKGISTGKLMKN